MGSHAKSKHRHHDTSAHGVALADPFRLERRSERRRHADESLTASFTQAPGAPRRLGITHLHIVDRSHSGLGAISRVAIERGAAVSICPRGSTVPWLATLAVRCEPCEDGFRIGLRYSPRGAA